MKQEPSSYSWADLVRDGGTRWDGIHSAAALLHVRRMSPGDEAVLYHSGEERACVGLMRISSSPRPDETDPRPSWVVDVVAVRPLGRPVLLSEMRADPAFADFALLRISRLSVMPFPDRAWNRMLALAAGAASPAGPPKAGTRGRARKRARRARGTAPRRRR